MLQYLMYNTLSGLDQKVMFQRKRSTLGAWVAHYQVFEDLEKEDGEYPRA